MNELIKKRLPPKIPQYWNYEESVKKTKGNIYTWLNLTKEIADEFWIAYTKLSSRRANKIDVEKSTSNVRTWTNYCQDCGIHRGTPLNWFYKLQWLEKKIINTEIQEIISYGENIYLQSGTYLESRFDDYIISSDQFPTLTTIGRFFHTDKREFTLREYASVQTFPESYKFVGSYSTIKKQIGNAVAPDMAKYIGQRLEGKTFADLFAGAGGLSCGLMRLNKIPIWAIERDKKLSITYEVNHGDTEMINADIKTLNPADRKQVDIIVGGPPCQGFSLAGDRFKDDSRNSLYKEFLRFVNLLRPAEFLMENVPQIQDIKEQIIQDFNDINYSVETELVKGLEIGMKQRRERYFFIGKLNEK